MADRDTKKYYWLKLQNDFFKRHDIRIIEGMPNGKDYVLFYLKLLCESTSHEGSLRFSETIPYSVEMLSTITNTNVDIVRSAVKIFTELGMMDILDDGTMFFCQVQKMIGSETGMAKRMREYRAKSGDVTPRLQCNPEIEIEIDKEIDKERNIKERKPSRFSPPTLEEVTQYCHERKNHIDPEYFIDFYTSKNWMVGKNKMKDWKAAVRNWERRDKAESPKKEIDPFQKLIEEGALDD